MWRARSARVLSVGSRGYCSSERVWGLIADTHFKEQSLSSIIKSTDWAIENFKEQKVSRVFLLGDILNTRQMVHLGAQSAAMKFIGKLLAEFPNVHVIVGNHDMHLRHSRSVTSLDALSLEPLSSRLTLHKEVEVINADGVPVLMIPYHHNEVELQHKLEQLQNEHSDTSNIVAMAHLSITGAISNKRAGMKFQGFLETKL